MMAYPASEETFGPTLSFISDSYGYHPATSTVTEYKDEMCMVGFEPIMESGVMSCDGPLPSVSDNVLPKNRTDFVLRLPDHEIKSVLQPIRQQILSLDTVLSIKDVSTNLALAISAQDMIDILKINGRNVDIDENVDGEYEEIKEQSNQPNDGRAIMSTSSSVTTFFHISLIVVLGVKLIVGIVLMAVSLWANLSPGFDQELQDILDQNNANTDFGKYRTAVWVLVGIGALVIMIGLVGCCGAVRRSRWMLALFIIIIIILFIVELATGVYMLINKDSFKAKLHEAMEDIEKKQGDIFKPIEDELFCCGVNGKRIGGLSVSPCDHPDTGGCFDKIWANLTEYSTVAGGVSIGLLVFEGLAILFAFCLSRTRSVEREDYLDSITLHF